ncbi:MAG TPA: geranylgeranyl reductase family protein [Halococcus sp.]|nr:geranylgeranyl reductase family protein [Halococcus sp.]
MTAERYDIAVVGAGTAGAFAAATAAGEGLSTVLLERKSADDVGDIACGDAVKGAATFPDVIDREYLRKESFTNEKITKARFENPQTGEHLDVPFPEGGAVVDRKRYGEVIVEETERAGADIHTDTVVQDVMQEDGRVTGVNAVRDGDATTYEADVVIDAAGSLSLLQDKTDFSGTTFDTNVNYSQFCSAYREIVEVDSPVEWDDALVFKPTEELGYLWYFPRTSTEINAGLGFQMNKSPMELVEVLREDLRNRPEFDGATVKHKLGAALPTRRPYDSATAPGFMAVGDAAGHVNPTTGGGIPGAAKAGHWAAQRAVEAVTSGDASEERLWKYNHQVMTDFGKRFAAMDIYNIFGGANDIDDLVSILTSLPSQQIIDALGKEGTASMSLGLKIKTAIKTFGHWETLYDLYQVQKKAAEVKELYDEYPSSPSGFEAWRDRRDDLMDEVYRVTGAEPKY